MTASSTFAADEIAADPDLTNTEILVMRKPDGSIALEEEIHKRLKGVIGDFADSLRRRLTALPQSTLAA